MALLLSVVRRLIWRAIGSEQLMQVMLDLVEARLKERLSQHDKQQPSTVMREDYVRNMYTNLPLDDEPSEGEQASERKFRDSHLG